MLISLICSTVINKVINKVIYRHFVFNLDKKGKGRHVFDDLLYKSY